MQAFALSAGITARASVPISALKGWNVVDAPAQAGWCDYAGPTLLQILEQLPVTAPDTDLPLAFPVQWVEKFASSSDTRQGRRIFWGRVAAGAVDVGQSVSVMPGGQTAIVAQVLDHVRQPRGVAAGASAGLVLDRELDISRGDRLLAGAAGCRSSRELHATVAWLDDEPLRAGRVYWVLHGHRWVKAKVRRIVHKLNIQTLAEEDATLLAPNDIGDIELTLHEPVISLPFGRSRRLGSLILVDLASHQTSGAGLLA